MWSHKLEQCTCAHLTAYSRSTTLGLRNNHRSQARTQPVIISVILAYCTHTVCTHIILSLDHVPNYYNSPYQWGCFSLSSVDGGMYDDLLVYNMARNSLLHPLHTVGLILRTTLITTECDLALSLTSLHPSWQIIYCALFLLKIIVTDKVFSYLFMMPQRSLDSQLCLGNLKIIKGMGWKHWSYIQRCCWGCSRKCCSDGHRWCWWNEHYM